MSDKPIRLEVSFTDEPTAEDVRQLLQDLQDWIFDNPDEGRYLSSFFADAGKDEGLSFSSFWVPSGKIERAGQTLKFECVGSSGDDWPVELGAFHYHQEDSI